MSGRLHADQTYERKGSWLAAQIGHSNARASSVKISTSESGWNASREKLMPSISLRNDLEGRHSGMVQGWKLTGAIKTAKCKLADGALRHSDQSVMSWAVANARVEPKGNAILVTKQASGSAKIDPLMAAFNAIALMSTNPWSTRPGIFVI
jgi:phage terminase large subunit-like protein